MIALGAELLAHQPVVARRMLPVDGAPVEAGHVVAQGIELRAGAELALRLHPQQGIDRGEMQRRAARRADRRQDVDLHPHRHAIAPLHQAIGAAPAQPQRLDLRHAAPQRAQRDLEADRVLRRQRGARQRRRIHDRRDVEAGLDGGRQVRPVDRQRDLQVGALADEQAVDRLHRHRQPPGRQRPRAVERDQHQHEQRDTSGRSATGPRPARQSPATAARPPPPARSRGGSGWIIAAPAPGR